MPRYRVVITYKEIVEQCGVCTVTADTEADAIDLAMEKNDRGEIEFKEIDGELWLPAEYEVADAEP